MRGMQRSSIRSIGFETPKAIMLRNVIILRRGDMAAAILAEPEKFDECESVTESIGRTLHPGPSGGLDVPAIELDVSSPCDAPSC
jgi:hypothetical protein